MFYILLLVSALRSGFNNIIVNGTALYTGDLPIDLEEYYRTGNIKPDIDMLGKYKEAQ